MAIAVPPAEAADIAIRAARFGVAPEIYGGVLALQGAYGFMHPSVVEFRNRPKAGVCGPETQEGEE